MIRALIGSVVAALLATLALSAGVAGAAGDDVRLTQAGGARFPDRSFVLSLPVGASAQQGDVHVTENGKPVANLDVLNTGASVQRRLGVVLVIDASRSMKDRIDDAMEAARTFASHRSPQQPLAVVTFNEEPATLLPFTTDSAQIDAALASTPKLELKTRLYDAVWSGLGVLRQGGATAGSIVVLSDGKDTSSQTPLDKVVNEARLAGIRVYTIGVGAPDSAALEQLASGTSGVYSQAGSSADLRAIYDRLGAEIASQYLVTYRSLAKPHQNIDVGATVDGVAGEAEVSYISPALAPGSAPEIHPRDLWQSPFAMLAVALFCAALIGYAVSLAARRHTTAVRQRMASFVSAPAETGGGSDLPDSVTDRALSRADQSLDRFSRWTRFKRDVDVAQVKLAPVQIVALTGIATVTLFVILLSATGSLLLALAALLVPVASRVWVSSKVAQQRKLFADQLADTLQVVASAMRAGHSFVAALAVGVEQTPEPAKRELSRVIVDERLGVPLEESLAVLSERMDSVEVEQVALVAILQRETGGNTAEVLDRVTDGIRERGDLRRLVASLTAQGRISRWVVTLLPVGLAVAVTLLNPGYLKPLVETSLGQMLIVLSALMIAAGSLAIKRIVEIKV